MSNFLPLEKVVMNEQRAILNLQKKKVNTNDHPGESEC